MSIQTIGGITCGMAIGLAVVYPISAIALFTLGYLLARGI